MRRPYRLARPVPSTACVSASTIHYAKMNHRILVGPLAAERGISNDEVTQ